MTALSQAHTPPNFVLKAMRRRWAQELFGGKLRLSSQHYYSHMEHPELGDPNEGRGIYLSDGLRLELGNAYAVFLWCSSWPDTDPADLLRLDPNYEVVVRIYDPGAFAERICEAAASSGLTLVPYIGPVVYDQGDEKSLAQIRELPWGWNTFQKEARFSRDREYRLAFEHYPEPRRDGSSKTEDECRAELEREHVSLDVSLPVGQVEWHLARP